MINPINTESPFSIEDLFFSITDSKGIILFGNDTFVQVSKYAFTELMGRPHNIIRHPDMPKTVFFLLWDVIKSGKPIAAYVKNMAKDGSYYWVFASVYQIPEGYLSIRIKPTSPLLPTVTDLYRKVLKIEKDQGVSVGLQTIQEALKTLGFSSYEEFMTRALTMELESREKLVDRSTRAVICDSSNDNGLWKVYERGKKMESNFRSMSHKMGSVITEISSINKCAGDLSKNFQQLHYMGINLLAAIEKLGKEAIALSQIVVGIENLSSELESQLGSVQTKMREVLLQVQSAEYLIQSCRLQSEMTKVFAEEIIRDNTKAAEKLLQCETLLQLTFKLVPSVVTATEQFSQVMRSYQKSIETFLQLSSGMEFIRLSSKIECAKLVQTAGINHFNEILGELILKIRNSLGEAAASSRSAYASSCEIRESLAADPAFFKKTAT